MKPDPPPPPLAPRRLPPDVDGGCGMEGLGVVVVLAVFAAVFAAVLLVYAALEAVT